MRNFWYFRNVETELMSTSCGKIKYRVWHFQSQHKTHGAFMASEDWFYELHQAKFCAEAGAGQTYYSQHSGISVETAYRFSDNPVFQVR